MNRRRMGWRRMDRRRFEIDACDIKSDYIRLDDSALGFIHARLGGSATGFIRARWALVG